MTYLEQLRLLLWTVRYLRPAQVYHRGMRVTRRCWWRLSGKKAPQPSDWQLDFRTSSYAGLPEFASQESWAGEVSIAVERARAVSQQRFCFLNRSVQFAVQPDWHDPALSQLWRYNLHYFNYVRDLLIWSANGQTTAAYSTFRTLASSWIDANRRVSGDGWHSYTLSLRIVNWLHAVQGFESELRADGLFRRELLSSLYGQAQVLASDLELDVRGNHLLENLRALIWVGIAFEGRDPERWSQRALTLLRRELAEQVCADGGHFERTPGYHLIVLENCLEIALLVKRNRGNSPKWLDSALRRMLDYLVSVLPPDRRVPLLKDTTWNTVTEPGDLLTAGALYFDEPAYKRTNGFGIYPLLLFGWSGWTRFRQWPLNDFPYGPQALTESAHYIIRDDVRREYLIFDAGQPCPDYLPAHAHADLLSYELLVDGQRIVVDSGVYEYAAGPWRDYFRSTRAHNTVEVAGENQSEVWSSFRVARRARPSPVVWQQAEEYVLVQGEHDGYRRLKVPVKHRRTLVWMKDGVWLVVDELLGEGRATASNFVHFHPDLILQGVDDSTWQIHGASSCLWLAAFGHGGRSVQRGQTNPSLQGWYSERFGELVPNSVLTLTQTALLPICYGYVISRGNDVRVKGIGTGKESRVSLTRNGRDYSLLLPSDAPACFQ